MADSKQRSNLYMTKDATDAGKWLAQAAGLSFGSYVEQLIRRECKGLATRFDDRYLAKPVLEAAKQPGGDV